MTSPQTLGAAHAPHGSPEPPTSSQPSGQRAVSRETPSPSSAVSRPHGPLSNKRHKLILTRGILERARYVDGATEAYRAAEEWMRETGTSVLVCEAPVGGLVRVVYTVKAPKQAKR